MELPITRGRSGTLGDSPSVLRKPPQVPPRNPMPSLSPFNANGGAKKPAVSFGVATSASETPQADTYSCEGDTFTYGELIGIIQYLKEYGTTMKQHLMRMDTDLGTNHMEDYASLSAILEKLGVRAESAPSRAAKPAAKDKRRSKFGVMGGVFASLRSSRK